MDSRHELFIQELLNQLITTINQYIIEKTDDLLIHQVAIDEIKEIAFSIFNYLPMDVDVEGILTKKNLLSIDIVAFPHIDEPTRHGMKSDHNESFIQLLEN